MITDQCHFCNNNKITDKCNICNICDNALNSVIVSNKLNDSNNNRNHNDKINIKFKDEICMICNYNKVVINKYTTKKKFNIMYCNDKKCKHKVNDIFKYINNIEKWYYGNINENKNTDKEHTKLNGNNNGNNNDNDDDYDIANILKESKSSIYLNPFVIQKIMTGLKHVGKLEDRVISRLFILIAAGPSLNLIKFVYEWYKKDDIFKDFVDNSQEDDLYQLRVKTNIDRFDYRWDEKDIIYVTDIKEKRKNDFIKLNFARFRDLIDFIDKLDYGYLFTKDKKNHFKYDIYASLFPLDNPIVRVMPRYIQQLTISPILPTLPSQRNYLEMSLKESLEKSPEYDKSPKYESEYWGLKNDKKNIVDTPNHFINTFNDEMIYGVDIFTLLLAFVTNKNTEWNFEFYSNYDDYDDNSNKSGKKNDVKQNFINYIFDEIKRKY